jgi:hypothetical protein
MPRLNREQMLTSLEGMLADSSMPEIVAALIRLSRKYGKLLRRERSNEYVGWEVWEKALSEALRKAAGRDELEELAGLD